MKNIVQLIYKKKDEEYNKLMDLLEYHNELLTKGEYDKAQELSEQIDYTRARWGLLEELTEDINK